MDALRPVLGPAPLALAPALRLIRPVFIEPVQDPLLPWGTTEPRAAPEAEVSTEARRVVMALTAALVEVLRGRRPLTHLESHADTPILDLLERLCSSGLRPGLRLASLRVGQPSDRVMEAAARLEMGDESRAAALRIVRRDERWRLVSVELALDAATIVRAG